MSERIGPPLPLPPLSPEQVRDSYSKLMHANLIQSNVEFEMFSENLSDWLIFLREHTTEWEELYGSIEQDIYRAGVRDGAMLASHYESQGLTLEGAANFAFNESMRRTIEQRTYPHNERFKIFMSQRLKFRMWKTRNMINYADSLYNGITGNFQDRQPHVAEHLFNTPMEGDHQTREPLRNLGIMDVLDTYRAMVMYSN